LDLSRIANQGNVNGYESPDGLPVFGFLEEKKGPSLKYNEQLTNKKVYQSHYEIAFGSAFFTRSICVTMLVPTFLYLTIKSAESLTKLYIF